jgi:cytochrome bd-type quinol oxidase subunit 2
MNKGERIRPTRRGVYRDTQLYSLREAANSAQLLGMVFTAVGTLIVALIMKATGRGLRGGLAVVAALLVGPGIFYVVAGVFLKRRRYWAWKSAQVMTIALLSLLVVAIIALIVALITNPEKGSVLGAVIGFGCWAGALVIIRFLLIDCLPAVMDKENAMRKGFFVLPAQPPPSDPPPTAQKAAPHDTMN